MNNQVKIIVNNLDAQEVKRIKLYVKNLIQIVGENLAVTILDPRYNGDYNKQLEKYDDIISVLPNSKINSFYISIYLHSDRQDNIKQFIESYIGKEKFTIEKNENGQQFLKQDGQTRVKVSTNMAGQITAVDFIKAGQNIPHQRVSVNSTGNIQVIRSFSGKDRLPLIDKYVDTELKTQMVVHFDERGFRSGYQLTSQEEPVVYSEIDLYEQWFNRVIEKDDYIINVNRHYDVLFEHYHDINKVFLM